MFRSKYYLIISTILILNICNLFPKNIIKYEFTGEMYFPENVILGEIDISNEINLSVKENVEKSINELLDFYSDSGFPLCEIKVVDLISNDDSTYCKIEINSGEYVRILFIEFDGIRVCNKDFLNRETRLVLNSKFSEKEVLIAMNYLYKTELFNYRPVYSIVKKGGKTGLKIILNEKKYFKGMFLGGINNSDKGSEFAGSGEFLAENIVGTNRKAGVKWLKKNDKDEKVHLMYREPYLLSYPISNKLVFEQESINLEFLKRKYEIFTEWTMNPESDIFVSYSQENIYPDSNNVEINSDVKINKYTGGLKYSTLYNSLLIPRESGFSISGSVSSINTDFAGKDSSSYAIQIDANIKKIFRLRDKVFLSLNYDQSQIFSSELVSSFNKITFGGAYGLRGYRDESFISDLRLLTEVELIFTPINDLGLGCFLDVAGFNPENENITDIDDIAYEFGYGIILTYLKNSNEIQFTIGIPGEKGFTESMVHVKYSYRF